MGLDNRPDFPMEQVEKANHEQLAAGIGSYR
jgi:hypothetical protein